MFYMEFYQAAVFCATVVLVVVLTARAGMPFFLALLIGALFFALLADMTLPSIGDSFSLGFAQTIDRFGLYIIAGSVVAACLERSGAWARLAAGKPPGSVTVVGVGLIAGLASSATAALALLRPWCLLAGGDAPGRARRVAMLALALSAGQAFVFPSLFAVATRTILKVDLVPMLVIGLGLAVVTAVLGALFVTWMTRQMPEPEARADASVAPAASTADKATIALPVLVPLLLLIAVSFARIPSEPLGRAAKEFLGFASGPMVILVLSLALALLSTRRWEVSSWLGGALTAAVGPLLAVGAAGGLVTVLQATGMAELAAEHITYFHLGLGVPFLAAAVLKVLQGSSLTATLTASGMVAPLLPALGLDTGWGPALAAGAIGAGTLIAHVNDPLFWLVADVGGLSPLRTLRLFTAGALVQAAGAALLLLLIASVIALI